MINQWNYECKPVTITYLLPDSTLIIPCAQDEINGLGGNNMSGGRILKLSWEGEILWDDIFIDSSFEPHHDIEPMKNGNVLLMN